MLHSILLLNNSDTCVRVWQSGGSHLSPGRCAEAEAGLQGSRTGGAAALAGPAALGSRPRPSGDPPASESHPPAHAQHTWLSAPLSFPLSTGCRVYCERHHHQAEEGPSASVGCMYPALPTTSDAAGPDVPTVEGVSCLPRTSRISQASAIFRLKCPPSASVDSDQCPCDASGSKGSHHCRIPGARGVSHLHSAGQVPGPRNQLPLLPCSSVGLRAITAEASAHGHPTATACAWSTWCIPRCMAACHVS